MHTSYSSQCVSFLCAAAVPRKSSASGTLQNLFEGAGGWGLKPVPILEDLGFISGVKVTHIQ